MGFPIVNGKSLTVKPIKKGFTLIELMITLSIVALLLTLVAPRYFRSIDKARDQVLIHQLNAMRQAIEQYSSDKGHYPENLSALVKEHYLKQIPIDPITERSDTWVTIPATATDSMSGNTMPTGTASTASGISDVH